MCLLCPHRMVLNNQEIMLDFNDVHRQNYVHLNYFHWNISKSTGAQSQSATGKMQKTKKAKHEFQ